MVAAIDLQRAETRAPANNLSWRVLRLDWSCVLPWQFEGVTVELGTFGDACDFMREHYLSIFGRQADRFLTEEMSPAKRRFGDEMDTLLFRADGRTVGLLLGHPIDWSTYYMRSVALLPNWRDRSLLATVLHRTYGPLADAGIDRIEGECSPTNHPMMRTLTREGWCVTSTSASERWGVTVHLTKFLRAEAEEVFARQFCTVRAGQRPASLSKAPERSAT
jgi:hypothetical protein